jgi:predicted aspartyl protease
MMSRSVAIVLFLLGLVPVGACLATWVGLGVLRGLPGPEIVGLAVAITGIPIAGIWALGGQQLSGLVAGMWAWPALLLFAVPGYFPGELDPAMSTGLSLLASPAGAGAARATADKLADRVAQLASAAPHVDGLAPLPDAVVAQRECPPAMVLGDDQVALPYEGQGHSMIIPAQFGDSELPMLFDTGASFTTLDSRTLKSLGLRVAPDAPVVTLHTANGDRTARLVIAPTVWVGGLPVEGVTIALCEECADDRVRGLLGLNVSGQFLVTIDTAGQQVLFQPRAGKPDRVADVQPWLETRATVTLFNDGRAEAEATATNRSNRRVEDAVVGVHCGKEHRTIDLGAIPAGETVSVKARLPQDAACETYTVTLDHARW